MSQTTAAVDALKQKHVAYPSRVVFLLGVMPRSGTNFLYELICAHPDCGGTGRISEDFLIANAHDLNHYVNQVHESWKKLWWPHDEALKDPLLKALGHGLETYLISLTSPRWLAEHPHNPKYLQGVKPSPPVVIARTPSVENLALLPKISDAKVIVIVRDGRSVVESGQRTFGWFFEDSTQKWARSARDIRSVTANHADQITYVRYEDLVNNKENILKQIFTFIGVDPNKYDYQNETPIRGSSTYFNPQDGINWQAIKETKEFDPLNRWAKWSRSKHERFNWVAGQELEFFDYLPMRRGGTLWTILNLFLDLLWPIRHRLRNLARKRIPKPVRDQVLWKRGQINRKFMPKKETPNQNEHVFR